MNRVEKLAADYNQTLRENQNLWSITSNEAAYEAGFRKAIELACNEAQKNAHTILCGDGRCDDWLEPCQAVHDISKIPDQEISQNKL